MNYLLARLNEQFGVTDHFFSLDSVHSVSGSDVRVYHPVIDGVILLLRRHFLPRRAVFSFDFLPFLHYFLSHGVDGGEVFKLLLLHRVQVKPRYRRDGHL